MTRKEILESYKAGDISVKEVKDELRKLTFQSYKSPLSEGQKGLWISYKIAPETSAYNIPLCFRVFHKPDIELLKKAFNIAAAQHPILLGSINDENGIPFIEYSTSSLVPFYYSKIDISNPADIETFLKQSAKKTFVLENGPLIRVDFISNAEKEYYLLITIHHIVFDGVSYLPFISSLLNAYDELAQGRTPRIISEKITYKDFVEWEKMLLTGDEGEMLRMYWKQQFDNDLPFLEIPTDGINSVDNNSEGKTYSFILPPKLSKHVRTFAQKHHKQLSTVFLGVFNVMLSKYSGQDDIIVAMPSMGRQQKDFDKLVGYFVNMLPVRTQVIEEMTFLQFVEDLQLKIADALDHSAYPFSMMVSDIDVPRMQTVSPLYQAIFAYQNFLEESSLLELLTQYSKTLELELIDFIHQEGEYPFGLEIIEYGEKLTLKIKYHNTLFNTSSISTMTQHYVNLMEGIIRDPHLSIGEYSMLTEKEENKLLNEWNDTEVGFPHDICIHEIFEQKVRKNPNAVAMIYMEQSFTYQELDKQSTILSHFLQKQGVKPDTLVGIYVKRSADMIIGILGILKAGGAYLPLDPDYPKDRLEYILHDSQIQIILTQDCLFKDIEAVTRDNFSIICLDKDWKRIESTVLDNEVLKHEVTSNHLAYVIYTSGSTGKPKGVMVNHNSIVNTLFSLESRYPVSVSDTYLFKTNYVFDVSISELFGWFVGNGKLAILPSGSEKSPEDIMNYIEKYRISHINFVPSMLSVFLSVIRNRKQFWENCPIRYLMVAGEAFSKKLVKESVNLFKDAQVENIYGPTEASIYSSWYSCTKNKIVSINTPIGKPLANTRLYVADQKLSLSPIGVPGELFIEGIGLAHGYLNNPTLTAEKFIDNPFNIGTRLYKTGDLVRWLPDGNIEYLGRIDHQVKIRGYRIELGEVEGQLRTHPHVEDCVVVSRDQGESKQLIAFYIPVSTSMDIEIPNAKKLRKHLKSFLPDYMIPAVFSEVKAFPHTSSGKIDRRALIKKQISHTMSPKIHQVESEIEINVLRIWEDVLNVHNINIEDGFFEAGGDSISAVTVAKQISTELDCDFEVSTLFKYSNIKDISTYISKSKRIIAGSAEGGLSILQEKDQTSNRERVKKDTYPEYYKESIAIIGISCNFPGAEDQFEFWHNLKFGKESIKQFTKRDLDSFNIPNSIVDNPDYKSIQATIEGKKYFDPAFFRISPKDAEMMDPQLRLLLQHSWKAIEDAGYIAGQIPETCVYMSASSSLYQALLPMINLNEIKVLQNYEEYVSWILAQGGTIPTMISHKLGLKGPSFFVHSNCSSTLAGLYSACHTLRAGESRYALVGGATLFPSTNLGYIHQAGLNFSGDGHCKTFDASADGMVGGEGVAVVMLKKAIHAIEDGDNIYGILREIQLNNDGADKAGFYAPSIKGQSEVIRNVLEKTGIHPESINYVEAHGTGTKLGDPVEIAALSDVYRQYTSSKQFCGIGSVKTNIGHLDTAAGLAGCIKVALSLSHQEIPPSLHYCEPNPNMNLNNSPFYVVDKLQKWEKVKEPRRAALNSFGIGGTNAHAIFEESVGTGVQECSSHDHDFFIVPLSARNEERLGKYAEKLLHFLEISEQDKKRSFLKQDYLVKDLKNYILKYFSTLLNVRIEDIDSDQHFEELNIDYLHLTSFFNTVQEKWKIDVEFNILVQAISINELAIYLVKHYEDKFTECFNEKEGGSNYCVSDIKMNDLAYTLQVGREAMENRVIFMVSDKADLIQKLNTYIEGKENDDYCFKGNRHQLKETLHLFDSDEDLDELLANWMRKGKVRKIAGLWSKGFSIDWNLLYPSDRPRRISLPTYPFVEEEYWIPEFQSNNGSETLKESFNFQKEVTEMLTFEEVWQEENLQQIKYFGEKVIVCFSSIAENQKKITEIIEKTDCKAQILFLSKKDDINQVSTNHYLISNNQDDYQKVFSSIKDEYHKIDNILYLWPLEDHTYITDYSPLVYILQGLASVGLSSCRMVVGAESKDDLDRCYIESWMGFERSIGLIMPNVKISIIYWIGRGELANTWFEKLWKESCNERFGSALYEEGIRKVCKIIPTQLANKPTVLRQGGTYIITGGLGGLGLIFSRYLTVTYKANLILLGRSPLNEDGQLTIKELERLGSQVQYIEADVGDFESMSINIQKARQQFKQIHGVIHAAGIRDRQNIKSKEIEKFCDVLHPKINGALVLDKVLKDDQLDFICYFSSSSALLGDFGVCDYASANRFLQSYAVYRNQKRQQITKHGKAVTILWPLWENGGMEIGDEDATKMYLKSSGQSFLTNKMGIEIFERILASEITQQLVLVGQPDRINRFLGTDSFNKSLSGAAFNGSHTNSEQVSAEQHLTMKLKEHVGKILKMPTDKLDSKSNLADLGFDSIRMVELAKEVSQLLEIEISPDIFFGYSSIEKLTGYLLTANRNAIEICYNTNKKKEEKLNHEESFVNRNNKEIQKTQEKTLSSQSEVPEPLAIIGMSGKFPQSENIEEMWRQVQEGIDAVGEIPFERFDFTDYYNSGKISSKRCGCIPEIREFDPLFFEISPEEAESMDPRQRLLLQEAWKALEDAGYGPKQIKTSTIGMFVGAEEGEYQRLVKDKGSVTSNHNGILASRLAYFLNISGPVMAINTSCSSGLVAVHQACWSLRNRECDTAIAAGVNLMLTPESFVGMSEIGMLSKDGKCFAFDSKANGIVPGEAVAAVVLKRLTQAEADGDPIHAIISGNGINYDGRTNGITAPDRLAQTELIKSVYNQYQINPEEIGYIVTHGTGTKLGDPVEINALTDAFKSYTSQQGYCAITSAKTNFGHTMAASGIVNLICMVKAIDHAVIPPSLHFEKGNEYINWDESPFYVNKTSRLWSGSGKEKRIGAISSFGMSGTNAHMVIQNYISINRGQKAVPFPYFLFVFSAKTLDSLNRKIKDMITMLENNQLQHSEMSDISYTLLEGRQHFLHRCAIVAKDAVEAVSLMKKLKDNCTSENFVRGELPYQLNLRKDKQSFGEDLLEQSISSIDSREKYKEILLLLAELYCQGYEFQWEELFKSVGAKRIHIPGYPFAREQYWVDSEDDDNKSNALGISYVHPLLHEHNSIPSGNSFCSVFTGEEFFLSDHVVKGRKVFPGVAHLEMVRAAVDYFVRLNNEEEVMIQISNVVWAQPIIVAEEHLNININLYPSGDGEARYEIYKEDVADEESTIYSQGIVTLYESTEIISVDLISLKSRCTQQVLNPSECYNYFKGHGMEYGATFQGLKSVYVGQNEVIGELFLPDSIFNANDRWGLHLGMFDSALQASIGLFWNTNQFTGNETFLPFAVEEFMVYGNCESKMWTWLRYSDDQSSDSSTLKLDMDLIDEQGRICLSMRGFSSRQLESDLKKTSFVVLEAN